MIRNRMLVDIIAYYKETGQMLRSTPARYEAEFPFLPEADSMALYNAQMQVQTACKNFFRDKSIEIPKFLTKRSPRQAYTTICINGNIADK